MGVEKRTKTVKYLVKRRVSRRPDENARVIYMTEFNLMVCKTFDYCRYIFFYIKMPALSRCNSNEIILGLRTNLFDFHASMFFDNIFFKCRNYLSNIIT